MFQQAFEVVSLKQTDGRWVIEGRAYLDVNLGDILATSVTGESTVKVVGLETYKRTTNHLSQMMTGTLFVVGELREPLNCIRALYCKPL